MTPSASMSCCTLLDDTIGIEAGGKRDTMSIKCEDLEAGRVSFADVTNGRRLSPIHPGEILRDDFLEPMKISVYTLAQIIKV